MPRWTLHLGWTLGLTALAASCGDDSEEPSSSASSSSGTAVVSSSSSVGAGGATTVGPSSGAGGVEELPVTFLVRGVVTDGTAPVEGASVLQGGGEVQQVTGPDGAFEIELTTELPGTPTLVAGKIGYRAGGKEIFELPTEAVELVLRAADPPDNEGYRFGDPGIGDPEHDISTAFCGHCHTTFVASFQGSGHQNATKDPWVQDLYAGVASARSEEGACDAVGGVLRSGKVPGTESDRDDRCYVGDGVLPDLNACGEQGEPACDDPELPADERPTDFGQCADCHAAGMDGPAGGRDLLEATGFGFEQGNFCDACHHVKDVDLDAPPGTAGRLVMQRPSERVDDQPGSQLRQVMFGPLLDVPNGFMGGSFQPKFMEATFCGGCHEQRQDALVPGTELDRTRWPDGLPTHSTFSEWSDSDFAAGGVPCQTCHMPPIEGMFNSVDVAEPETAGVASGFQRPAERNRSHAFVGALQGTPRLIETAMSMSLDAIGDAATGTVEVEVVVRNFGAGHAIPTGEPMRSVLVVLVADGCGERLDAVAGNAIGDTGGSLADGVVGDDLDTGGAWPAGAAVAKPGDRVRVTRPSGDFLDYPGIGYFADPSLAPDEKGVPIAVPVQDVEVTDVIGDVLVTEPALELVTGDVVWLGEAPDLNEGAAVRALAGMPGQDFARITVDAAGRRHVPHHRAVDLASDHRVPPNGEVTSSHTFQLPAGCTEASVTATLLYRRAHLALARERDWGLEEHVVTTAARGVVLR